jgi:hypothetical protein
MGEGFDAGKVNRVAGSFLLTHCHESGVMGRHSSAAERQHSLAQRVSAGNDAQKRMSLVGALLT